MKKNPHDKILREKSKKQHLSTVSNAYPIYIYMCVCGGGGGRGNIYLQ